MPNISQSYLEALSLARQLNQDIYRAKERASDSTSSAEYKLVQTEQVGNLTKLLTEVETVLAAAKPSAVR